MPRLPAVQEADLDSEQRAVWERITGGARAAAHEGTGGLVGEDGALVGPFNAWLHSPAVGGPAAELGEAVRFRTSLDRRLLELAIVAVACHWRSNFEYWAHRRYALDAGVEPALLDALAAGQDPRSSRDDEQVVLDACRDLLRSGRLGAARYSATLDVLGTSGVVELVTAVGYYTLVSFNLNAFEVDVPPSAAATWPT